jgi:predicted membrane-bound mannosyltransferase
MYLRKHLRIDLYDLWALGIILFAILLRLILIGVGWPPTDSDESTIGLMALHIAYHGEAPIFFYGQGYMGTLEAYLPALLFYLFGP